MAKYTTCVIAAVARDGAMGIEGKLPWDCPEDMRRFVCLTSGKIILMGRKTAEGLPRALRNRINLVMTRDRTWSKPGFIPVHDMWDVRNHIKKHPVKELWVIGGAEIYKRFLPQAATVHLTMLDIDVPQADTWFPMDALDQFPGRVVQHGADPLVRYWVLNRGVTAPKRGEIEP